MINLPNGCKCSTLNVFPKNWKSKQAKTHFDWYITYRFYDPQFPNPKLVKVKGMNQFKQLTDRQATVERILNEEVDKLVRLQFNPFIKHTTVETGNDQHPITLVKALDLAYEAINVTPITKACVKQTLSDVKKALIKVGLSTSPITQITRKSIRLILDAASTTVDRFNKHRSYLMILFSQLCELEVIDNNPVRDVKKKKIVKKIRLVLTTEEREKVNDHLKLNYPEFHRFLHIFFHSGARITELLKVRKADVDLLNQRFKITILKGRQYSEVWKTVKDISFDLWTQAYNQAHPSDYLFSLGLKPGQQQIKPYQIGKRWYRLVKKKLNICADFYSLKHLHTTEVVELLGDMDAARHNGHRSTAMVVGIYDVKREERKHDKIKSLNNSFA